MPIELLPDLTNVVRFPVERRVVPSIELVFEIAPDCREVERVGEAFHLELPPRDLHHRVDAETAIHIAGHVLPLVPVERRRTLDALLRPVVASAVDACRQADHAGRHAVEAQERLVRAQAEHGSGPWLALLEEQADALTRQAAELLVFAHRCCQEARGVARAVGFARRGELWAPFDLHAVTEALLEGEWRHRAREAAQGG